MVNVPIRTRKAMFLSGKNIEKTIKFPIKIQKLLLLSGKKMIIQRFSNEFSVKSKKNTR